MSWENVKLMGRYANRLGNMRRDLGNVCTPAGCYGTLAQNWGIIGKLRGSITDEDIRTLEATVATPAA